MIYQPYLKLMMGVFASICASKKHDQPVYQPTPVSTEKRVRGTRRLTKNITSHGKKPEYGHLQRRPIVQERIDDRRRRHLRRVQALGDRGIYWTPFGLYKMYSDSKQALKIAA